MENLIWFIKVCGFVNQIFYYFFVKKESHQTKVYHMANIGRVKDKY